MNNQNYIATLATNGGQQQFIRSLKLQLLTRTRVIIAGTALVSTDGMQLFAAEPALIGAVETSALLPAIRDDFEDVARFIEVHHKRALSESERLVFNRRIPNCYRWSSQVIADFFEELVVGALTGTDARFSSVALDPDLASQVIGVARRLSQDSKLRPRNLIESAKQCVPQRLDAIATFVDLAYRLSGAQAVDSVAVLPNTEFVLDEVNISMVTTPDLEERLFWDGFVGAIHEFDPASGLFSPSQLDALDIKTILKIREKLHDQQFWTSYNQVMKEADAIVEYDEARRLIIRVDEIKTAFTQAIHKELGKDLSEKREELFYEGATTLVSLADTALGGALSTTTKVAKLAVKTIDVVSPTTVEKFLRFRQRLRAQVNGNTQLRQPLLQGYDAIALRPVRKT